MIQHDVVAIDWLRLSFLEKLRGLFVDAGLLEVSCDYVLRETVNVKEAICVPRVFVQAKYCKPT